jgi:phage shock protein A
MTNPQILLIILVLVACWVYFQQNNSNQPNVSDNSSQISELKNQVQHYQTLYQKRVEKDLEADQSKKIRELVANCQNLESNLAGETQIKNLFQQKVESLENQLLNLAQQKVKGKKEAEKLLAELNNN